VDNHAASGERMRDMEERQRRARHQQRIRRLVGLVILVVIVGGVLWWVRNNPDQVQMLLDKIKGLTGAKNGG